MSVIQSGEQGRIKQVGCFDQTSVNQLRSSLGQGNSYLLNGLTDVAQYPGTNIFTGAAIDAATAPAPIAGPQDAPTSTNPATPGDDGCNLTFLDAVGFAHTVTFPAGSIWNGSGASKHILTFSGNRGATITLEAYAGFWYVVGTPVGVVLT